MEVSIVEGAYNKQKEMIMNMYQNGISLDLIVKSANISINDAKNILNIN